MYLTCKNCSTKFIIDENLLVPDGKKVKCSKCGDIWYQQYSPPTDSKPAKDIKNTIPTKATQAQNLIPDQLTKEIKNNKEDTLENNAPDTTSAEKKAPESSKMFKEKNRTPQEIKNEKLIMRPGLATYHLPVIISKTQDNLRNSNAAFYLLLVSFSLYSVLLYLAHYQISMLASLNPNFDITLIGRAQNTFEDRLLIKYRITNLSNTDKYIPKVNIQFLDDRSRQIFTSTIDAQHVLLKSQNYIYLTQSFENIRKPTNIYTITLK
jgi:predicted Zn finger-like uncharacterized protein